MGKFLFLVVWINFIFWVVEICIIWIGVLIVFINFNIVVKVEVLVIVGILGKFKWIELYFFCIILLFVNLELL